MARDIEPAKRGDLIGHFVGERFECVTPLVRYLEGAKQIPPVESGRAFREKPDTDRIDNTPHQDTEIGPRPDLMSKASQAPKTEVGKRPTQKQPPQVEAGKRPTQKAPPAAINERATKPIETTSSERLTKPVTGGVPFPERPTDSVFMDPVIMADDSFFEDENFAADAPTINEPLPSLQAPPAKPPTGKVPAAPASKVPTGKVPAAPATKVPTGKVPAAPPPPPAKNLPASAAPIVPSPEDTVFEAKPLDAAPSLDSAEMSIDMELPSFSDEPAVEKDTSVIEKAKEQERPTTKVELRTDTKPSTGRKAGEVVRDTVNFYNQTSSLKDIIDSVMAEEPPTFKGMLPKDPLKPANVAPPSDFLNSDNLAPSLMDEDEEETDMSPTQSDDRRLGTERLPATPSDGLAPSADESFDAVGSGAGTVFDFNDTGAAAPTPPAPAAAQSLTPTSKLPPSKPRVPTAKVAPMPEPELPMPEAVGGDFLNNDELPSAAGDRITPEFLAAAPGAPVEPAAPAKPAAPGVVPLSKAAQSPTAFEMAENEAMALNGRTVALPPPPEGRHTRGRMLHPPPPAAPAPPARVPTAPVAKTPSNRMPAVPAPAAVSAASIKPITGKVPVPAAPARPITGKVPAPAPASLPEAKTEIGLPAAAINAAAKAATSAASASSSGSSRLRPALGQREAVRPTQPVVNEVSDSAATIIPGMVTAGEAPTAKVAPAAPAPAKVEARTPTAKQAPVPPARPSTKLPLPAPVAEKPQEALVGGDSSGETTIIVEPRQMMPTTNAVAQTAKPPAVTVFPSVEARQPEAAAESASTTIFDVPLQKLEAAKASGRIPTARVSQPLSDRTAAKPPAKVEAPVTPAAVPAAAAKQTDAVSRRLRQDRLDTRKLIESAEAVLAKLKGLTFTPPRRVAREETGRRAAVSSKSEAAATVGASQQSGSQARMGGYESGAVAGSSPSNVADYGGSPGGPGTIEARDLRSYRPPTARVSYDELLLGEAPDDRGPVSRLRSITDSVSHSRRETVRREVVPREPITRKNDPPQDDMDMDALLAAASELRTETDSSRRPAVQPESPTRRFEAPPVPPPVEPEAQASTRKMTSVLAKELDGMLKQMAANSARLPQEPVQDKIAPKGTGISFLDGPLWQTLLGLAGMSAFLTALFILIWFFLIKG